MRHLFLKWLRGVPEEIYNHRSDELFDSRIDNEELKMGALVDAVQEVLEQADQDQEVGQVAQPQVVLGAEQHGEGGCPGGDPPREAQLEPQG